MINAEEVEEIFLNCLWSDKQIKTLGEEYLLAHSIKIEGITLLAAFNPERTEYHAKRISEILAELNPQFFHNVGGGLSFLQLPFTKDEEQWGEHKNAEQLMLLGMAINQVKYALANRSMWVAFAGHMPYIIVNLEGFDDGVQPAEAS